MRVEEDIGREAVRDAVAYERAKHGRLKHMEEEENGDYEISRYEDEYYDAFEEDEGAAEGTRTDPGDV